jgi:hypothetical protein
MKQRTFERPAAHRFEQLQMAAGRLVQEHEIPGAISCYIPYVPGAGLLGLGQIMYQRARGTSAQRHFGQTETFEGFHLQLLFQDIFSA